MTYYNPFKGTRLRPGTFIRRPNRFVAVCDVDGVETPCHLPNPGRLWEILLPGTRLTLVKNSGGKTPFTVVAADSAAETMFLHTHRTNDLVQELLRDKSIPFFKKHRIVRREVSFGESRFDFLLETPDGKPFLLEVKSCTLIGEQGAMFPDAPSERAVRHVKELTTLARSGTACGVLFVVHSRRPHWFLPDYHTDPDFAQSLLDGEGAISVAALGVEWTKDVTMVESPREIPVLWDLLKRSFGDLGGCLATFRLDRRLWLSMEGNSVEVPPGYWAIASGAIHGLPAVLRALTGKRVRPQTLWDEIRSRVTLKTIPVRSTRDLGLEIKECLRAISINEIFIPPVANREAPAALFAFDDDPFKKRAFVDIILRLRMSMALNR